MTQSHLNDHPVNAFVLVQILEAIRESNFDIPDGNVRAIINIVRHIEIAERLEQDGHDLNLTPEQRFELSISRADYWDKKHLYGLLVDRIHRASSELK